MPSHGLTEKLEPPPIADTKKCGDAAPVSSFRLGLFGDTRSGKTMYLTSLFSSAQDGSLPNGSNLRASPGVSLRHLNSRVAMIRAGQWPPGDVDIEPIELLLDYQGRAFSLRTKDFKGGDFGDITEPDSRAAFEQFIAELFDGCSAYVFLVDPGVIRRAAEATTSQETIFSRARESLRVTTAVEMALEKLRTTGRISHLLHRPVAIVFTKADLHPDVNADPEAFARRYLPTVCKYLDDYARHRSAYFAVSSTGPLGGADGHTPSPPRPLAPQNLLGPLLWCINQHLGRRRILKRFACATGVVVALALYGYLFAQNGHRLQAICRELPEANSDRFGELYRESHSLSYSWLMAMTHPFDRERVRQRVVASARDWLQPEINKRSDSDRHLRTTADYSHVSQLTDRFTHDYSGTPEARELEVWLRGQRKLLAEQVVKELFRLAQGGQSLNFADKLKEYELVAIPECDASIRKAMETLDRKIVMGTLVRLYLTRREPNPDLTKLRELCAEAETEIAGRNLREDQREVQYVRKTRALYEPIAKGGSERPFRFRINASSTRQLKWCVYPNSDSEKELVRTNEWETPLNDPEDSKWYFVQGKASIDLFKTRKIVVWLTEDTWWGKGEGKYEVVLEGLKWNTWGNFETNKQITYFVMFYDDSQEIQAYHQAITEIRRLEDELFRAPQ